jgi:hypothetical protein
MSFWDWLPTNWGELCRNADTSRFAWAHNGANKNGWIELHENGRVTTSWCEGSWKAVESDADVIEVTFGSCKHMCRFRTGGFEVEQRISKKSGTDTYKPSRPRSCGWIGTSVPRSTDGGGQDGATRPKRAMKVAPNTESKGKTNKLAMKASAMKAGINAAMKSAPKPVKKVAMKAVVKKSMKGKK